MSQILDLPAWCDEMKVQFDRTELEDFFEGFSPLPNPLDEPWPAEGAELSRSI